MMKGVKMSKSKTKSFERGLNITVPVWWVTVEVQFILWSNCGMDLELKLIPALARLNHTYLCPFCPPPLCPSHTILFIFLQHLFSNFLCVGLSISNYSTINPSSWSVTGTVLSVVTRVAQITVLHSLSGLSHTMWPRPVRQSMEHLQKALACTHWSPWAGGRLSLVTLGLVFSCLGRKGSVFFGHMEYLLFAALFFKWCAPVLCILEIDTIPPIYDHVLSVACHYLLMSLLFSQITLSK